MKKKKHRGKGREFWNAEYRSAEHLAISENASEDLEKFTRYLEREYGRKYLHPLGSTLDLGCGNGRNLIWLSRSFGMRGVGYDISHEAISQAKRASAGLPLLYEVRSIAEPIPLHDSSQTLVLDMMSSHVLDKAGRERLLNEILRVLKPGGFLFYKTFLFDEDRNAARMLKEFPADEPGSYIHPDIGVAEHVFTQDEIENNLNSEFFLILKIHKSHLHIKGGEAFKRRTISAYARKPEF